jgi:hypothetical protein
MPTSQKERACITRHNGERYESGLLWKKDDTKLQNNFFAAQRCFFIPESKFFKNPVLVETYKAIIDTYVNFKHVRKLSREEIDARPEGRTWYNPHHLVFDTYKPGPDLFTNLVGILLRFHQYAYPVAEVEKIFSKVRVRPSNGPAFWFLWRNPDSKEPPDVYQMDFHPFGAASSPTVYHCIYPARDDIATIELHILGNVSEMGFGATSYIRFVYTDGMADVCPLILKPRDAQLKFMTIPCLELNIAVFAARQAVQVRQAYDVIFESTTYWSDSTTVLNWINSRTYRFNNCDGNIMVEILESSTPNQPKYVTSLVNLADDASRGLGLSEFSTQHHWFSGPDFLKTSADWPRPPTLPPLDENDPEIGEATFVGLIHRESDPIDKSTDKSRIFIVINAISYILRFPHNARTTRDRRSERRMDALTCEEKEAARSFLIRRVQPSVYQAEVDDLRAGMRIERNSSLIKLFRYLDHRGLLCVGGRIEEAPLPIDVRHPIIPPRSERVTELILYALFTLFLLESVRIREYAPGVAKRRAGDVAEFGLGKTVQIADGTKR